MRGMPVKGGAKRGRKKHNSRDFSFVVFSFSLAVHANMLIEVIQV